jgi:hypothetical protein
MFGVSFEWPSLLLAGEMVSRVMGVVGKCVA